MSIFEKLMSAVKSGAREVGETIVDANGIRILEQEVVDVEASLHQAKRQLTQIMAEQKRTDREMSRLKSEVLKYEGYAAEALNKGDESLALEVVRKVASIETELKEHEQVAASLANHAQRLKALVSKSETIVRDHKRQLMMVKTTDSVQKATASISENYISTNSKVVSIQESLQKIKEKQDSFRDTMAAAEALQCEVDGEPLENKLKEAGIVASNSQLEQDILERVKAKKLA